MTVKVITNISSKQHAGPAYFRLDGKNQKIKNDLVDLNVSPGEHHIEIGYLYGGTELKHYVNDVVVEITRACIIGNEAAISSPWEEARLAEHAVF